MLVALLLVGVVPLWAAASEEADRLHDQGNYREALEAYREYFAKPVPNDADPSVHLDKAVNCLRRLNLIHELDELLASAAESCKFNWRGQQAVATTLLTCEHRGYLIDGQFQRGTSRRDKGQPVNNYEADRTAALRFYWKAYMLLALDSRTRPNTTVFFSNWAGALSHSYTGMPDAWRMQQLTDLDDSPQPAEGWWQPNAGPEGAPVGEDGTPVYFSEPQSWEAAASDGQRWRWVLAEGARWNPKQEDDFLYIRGDLLYRQFGVQTLQSMPDFWRLWSAGKPDDNTKEILQLTTLSDDETIARLATGVKRFPLPEEHNHMRLFQQALAAAEKVGDPHGAAYAASRLAECYENRRQYPRAAEYWRRALEHAQNESQRERYQERLDQITGNWGQLEALSTQEAGAGAAVAFRYRNAKRVELTARTIDTAALLRDVKAYLGSNPDKLQHERMEIENLGYRLVTEGDEKYLGKEAARWSVDFDPPEGHFDRTMEIATPLQKPGAYLLTADVEEGNSTSVVVWVQDTAIVEKPMDGRTLYYVADATTGKPIGGCTLDLFGYRQEQDDPFGSEKQSGVNRFTVKTSRRTVVTTPDGTVEVPVVEAEQHYQWIATATAGGGRFAFLGFHGVWTGPGRGGGIQAYSGGMGGYGRSGDDYRQVKVFTITDRPVYRPGQDVRLKFWVRTASYDLQQESRFAGKSFRIELRSPTDEVVKAETLIADAYGGLETSWKIPDDARLGNYRVNVVNHGGGSFRVEEYKKPEYEVKVDGPDEPVALGETIAASISAKYYYGSPVTEATVRYKVFRSPIAEHWYPPSPWDWLYGRGYWWSVPERYWYPGRMRWGCFGPAPSWIWFPPAPPELVTQNEVKIGPEGKIEIEIDTSLAQALHPDDDHRYTIEAEVVDRSRRTVVGRGEVVATRQPFRVFVWTDRGHYRTDDTVTARIAARDASGKPVQGSGSLRLLRIRYEGDEPLETEVGNWDLRTDEEGSAHLEIKAADSGEYRLSYELTDAAGRTVEGGHFFSVRGPGTGEEDFRFDAIEIVPDKTHYAPGEDAKLLINCNRAGATVLLFPRAESGVYPTPRVIKLTGKSTTESLKIEPGDMPNLFVEAVVVHSGKAHTVVKELFVPPSGRVLNVEVLPSAETYLPGQEASCQVRVTDADGNPVVGSLCGTVYDRSLEYISGGSNVGDIREFFWKWKREHRPQTQCNLDRTSFPVQPRGEPMMRQIGVFGHHGTSTRGGFAGGRYGGIRERYFFGDSLYAAKSSAPMSAMVDSVEAVKEEAAGYGGDLGIDLETAPAADVDVYVRKNLADAAVWVGALETDASGVAKLDFTMPENLTAWKIRVWAMGHGTRVGESTAEVVTRKNLVVRLQTPRFLIERDEVVISANVHNYLPGDQRVVVTLAVPEGLLKPQDALVRTVSIEAGGERRVDWRVDALAEGEATVTVTAKGADDSDGMQLDLPIHVRGVLQTESYTGVIRPEDESASFTVDVPAERRPEQTRLEVVFSPSLAPTMLETLPYLIEYPHGCTEQTLNRFLPAVLCQKVLRGMGLSLDDLHQKTDGPRPEEHGEAAPKHKPVLDNKRLDEIVDTGIARLESMQLSDGSWGWFSGWGEHSSPHTTAVVVRGLLVAEKSGVVVPKKMLRRGVEWLSAYEQNQIEMIERWPDRELPENKDLPAKRWADNQDALTTLVLTQADAGDPRMIKFLDRDRTQLSAYGLTAFGLALHRLEEAEKLDIVMRNLTQLVERDDDNQTAWLELPGGSWWYWYGNEIETQAFFLKLLCATEPRGELAPRLVKYLVANRRNATYWNSTRDTALVVEALADYLAASGEGEASAEIEVWVDGELRREVSVGPENLLSMENRLSMEGKGLATGQHTVELRKRGEGPLYWSGYLTNFTMEEDIDPAGLELRVQRRFYRLVEEDATSPVAGGRGQVIDQAVERYRRIPIEHGDQLTSGDLIEVELTVESKNDYEYILLEDRKAAGLEPVEVRSGYNGNELGAYIEYRDDRVNLYATRLPRGRHSVTYRLRAEVPGTFSALPTDIEAMYSPQLRGNSASHTLRIED